MSKPYTDVFNKPLSREDVTLAVRVILQSNQTTAGVLQRKLRWGYGKILRVYELLEDAGVVSPPGSNKMHSLLLRKEPEAINAALRQLKKGTK